MVSKPREPGPALPFCGLLWSAEEAADAALELLFRRFGPPCLATPRESFSHTSYYEKEMGRPIWRSYLLFPSPFPPDQLAETKLWTNALEEDLRRRFRPQGRPVNLDPGYLALEKLVLATTKDRSHRVYLGRGIYAESTLHYHQGRYRPWPWTYPDYARPLVALFLRAGRQILKRLRRGEQA